MGNHGAGGTWELKGVERSINRMPGWFRLGDVSTYAKTAHWGSVGFGEVVGERLALFGAGDGADESHAAVWMAAGGLVTPVGGPNSGGVIADKLQLPQLNLRQDHARVYELNGEREKQQERT